MSITAEKKAEVIKDNARADNDTGSPEVQVAILTTRINQLTDEATRRGLARPRHDVGASSNPSAAGQA